jgi:hypothetical protein
MDIKIQMPTKMQCIFLKALIKVFYGGRGGGKSYNISDYIIYRMLEEKLIVLCTRQIQNSISDSVHALLCNSISKFKLEHLFTVQDRTIKCINGSYVIFDGLLRNIKKIKSKQGIRLAWYEESDDITEESLNIMLPTIRDTIEKKFDTKEEMEKFLDKEKYINLPEFTTKKDKLIIDIPPENIFSLNPDLENDPVYQNFVINPPEGAIVQKINFNDNPWFPAALEKLRKECLRDNPHEYPHIWLGEPQGGGKRVIPKFSDKFHVAERFSLAEMKDRGNIFMAMDPHVNYYPAILWGCKIPVDHKEKEFYYYIFQEWPGEFVLDGMYAKLRKKKTFNYSVRELTTSIYSKEQFNITKRFIDTRFIQSNAKSSYYCDGLIEVFAKPENGGMLFNMPTCKSLDLQLKNIENDLTFNINMEISPFNTPKLFIDPGCKNLIQSLKFHCYDSKNPNKQSETYKDFFDALKIFYAGAKETTYKNPNKKQYNYNKYNNSNWLEK